MNKLEHPRGEANRFQAFMTKSPAGLRPDFVRFYILGRIAYPLGFLGHAGFLGMFWLLDLKVLAAFNIISIAIFLLAIWAHNRGEMLWPVILTLFFEIPVHAVLATVYIGLGSAFWIFFFTNIVVLLLVPFVPRSVRITACIGFSFTLAALAIFSFSIGPLQPIASEWVIFFFAFNIMFFASILIAVISSFELAVIRAEDALQTEFGRAEMLLHNILPADIALRLKAREEPLADQHDSVSVLFADLAGFTNLSRTLSAGELVNLLNDLFSRFDDLANKHGAEKIKTIGDAYMVATGLSGNVADHAEKIADLALACRRRLLSFAPSITSI